MEMEKPLTLKFVLWTVFAIIFSTFKTVSYSPAHLVSARSKYLAWAHPTGLKAQPPYSIQWGFTRSTLIWPRPFSTVVFPPLKKSHHFLKERPLRWCLWECRISLSESRIHKTNQKCPSKSSHTYVTHYFIHCQGIPKRHHPKRIMAFYSKRE